MDGSDTDIALVEDKPPDAIRFLIVVKTYSSLVAHDPLSHMGSHTYIQDDSPLNRKIVMRIISAENGGRFGVVEFIEADDGSTAVEALRSEMAAGRSIDFVLMDFVMVSPFSIHINSVVYYHEL